VAGSSAPNQLPERMIATAQVPRPHRGEQTTQRDHAAAAAICDTSCCVGAHDDHEGMQITPTDRMLCGEGMSGTLKRHDPIHLALVGDVDVDLRGDVAGECADDFQGTRTTRRGRGRRLVIAVRSSHAQSFRARMRR